MGDPQIGEVQRVNLNIQQGADLVFDVEWWEDVEHTVPIPIAEVRSHARAAYEDTEPLLDIGAYATVIGEDANIAHISVPASVTKDVPVVDRGVWDLELVNANNDETKKIMRGVVRVHRETTR